jgi:hypothetical protein
MIIIIKIIVNIVDIKILGNYILHINYNMDIINHKIRIKLKYLIDNFHKVQDKYIIIIIIIIIIMLLILVIIIIIHNIRYKLIIILK